MKTFLIISFSSIILAFSVYRKNRLSKISVERIEYEKAIKKVRATVITCSPDWSSYALSGDDIVNMKPLPGTGKHAWRITVQNDSAQFYFNQGINLYYGFHIAEALPSFKKAQTFDSSSAMLYWGEALAYGPNINDLGYFESPAALTAANKALSLSAKSSSKEHALINAMAKRYTADTTITRATLNETYAAQMSALYKAYPKDQEIGALYADALMQLHPWDLWKHDGTPQPWEPELQTVLENVLRYAPDHPGANHYYIHTVEASPFAYKASASADRLGALTPGLAHMVHMPSHIYIRTGKYEKGEAVNTAAVAAYKKYLALFPDVQSGAGLYEVHNLHMLAACAMNRNDYGTALKDAMLCRNNIDTSWLKMDAPMGNFIQYVYMTPIMAMVNFEKWETVLAEPTPSSSLHYAAALDAFAKGMAYANTNRIAAAQEQLGKLQGSLKEKDMEVIFPPFNSPLSAGKVAENILQGCIAEKNNSISQALSFYRAAQTYEDALVYNEPRDWLLPARHFLGNALLRQHENKKAAVIFKEDLKISPANHISTMGLKNAISAK